MVNLNDKPGWDWLPTDENDNPVFSDLDDIIFFGWMRDQIVWERPARPGRSDMEGPPLWVILGAPAIAIVMLLLAYFMW